MTRKTDEPVIAGLDLAEKLGICVVTTGGLRLLWSDSILLARRDPDKRLVRLKNLLDEVFKRFNIVEVAIEDVFLPLKTSRKTPIALGELRGVARLCAAERNIPTFFYSPAKVKSTITGSGSAGKADVVAFIESEFKIKLHDHNEADAIGIAYTHWLNRRFMQAIESDTNG